MILLQSNPTVFDPHNINVAAFALVFAAGLLSFLSPCVLPLVPAYIGYLSGATVSADGLQDSERRALKHATAFVAGFGILFVVAGAGIGFAAALMGGTGGTSFDPFVLQRIIARVGAILLAVMAVRVGDAHLDGDWRVRVGGLELDWPGRLAGIPQKYVRWALIGLIVALATLKLSFVPQNMKLLDAAILGIVVFSGAGLGKPGAATLGLIVAALNTYRIYLDQLYSPASIAAQAVLVFLIVYYVSRTNLFYQDRRIQVSSRLQNRGYLTSAIMGTVFAAGWTPCTGPNLALALTVAGSSSTAGEGAALLSTYAMGLGIPFLIVGFAFGSATRLMRRLTPYMGWIKLVNMVLLLAMAVLIASNALASLSGQGTFLQSIFDINL